MSRGRGLRFAGVVAVAAALVAAGGSLPAQADPAETFLSVPTGRYPIDVDASPDDSYTFVLDRGDGASADLRVFDASDFSLVNTITFGTSDDFNPTSVEVTPDGAQVWVSFYNPGQIRVYPTAELIAGGSPAPMIFTGGGGFVDLMAGPAGVYMYAATLHNPQYQFQIADPLAAPRTLDVTGGSRGVAVRTDGTQVYFTVHATAPNGGVQIIEVAGDGSWALASTSPA
ncbi:YncE family protein [Agromyces larvae]|uniref:YncE family protein n=1 Tax=Agromyces larvae TaxID=2929802 RepID=A0ABY4BVM6_9MICO|nr:hypothetical protein [Agromyces larvae]UOE43266.1 hypothetical protein MTO99_13875 [Agromyces larvae]